MGFSPRAGARPGWAPAPSLADGNPFPGHLLPSLGARWVRSSSGPSPAGHGCFGGCPGAAPWGAGEAVSTLGRLSHCPGSPGGASPPGGLRRGASGGACGLAQSRGGRSLWAQGQASLARPQLWRGARGVNPGLGGSSRHRDGGGVMGAAGRAHIGRPIHGQQGRPHGPPSWRERGEETVRRRPGFSPLLHSDDSGAVRPSTRGAPGLLASLPDSRQIPVLCLERCCKGHAHTGGKCFVGFMCWTNGVHSLPSTPLLSIDPDRPLPLRSLLAPECSWEANCLVPQPSLCTTLPLATSPGGTRLSPRGVSSSRLYWLQRWDSQSQSPKS